MKVLILDNYDSFTYNVAHLVYRAIGVWPVVVYNDDVNWKYEDIHEYDAVIISPGPGSAENYADFGHCREVVQKAAIPILGICLGHQGIVHYHGGTVEKADEPVHGREYVVYPEQNKECVLHGLSGTFKVVRYHSMIATEVPSNIEITARTQCNKVMAVRHTELPLWGVQFHPESICSDNGEKILKTFFSLAKEYNRSKALFAKDTLKPNPTDSSERFELKTEIRSTNHSSEFIFEALFSKSKTAFWLDSNLQVEDVGRYSILGDGSGPYSRHASYDVSTKQVTVTKFSTNRTTVVNSFFEWLDDQVRLQHFKSDVSTVPFNGGWVGYLGYELKAESGGDMVHRSDTPDAQFVFSDRFVVYDHTTKRVTIAALVKGNEDETDKQMDWVKSISDQIASFDSVSDGKGKEIVTNKSDVEFRLRHDISNYLKKIDECKGFIELGESYELCLTNMATATVPDNDSYSVYKSLRRESPAPYSAYLRFNELSILSSSPERFLKIEDGVVSSCPIKGTRPRGATDLEDQQLYDDLKSNIKDRAENMMIVDLVRNDLGRCAEPDSVTVPELFEVKTYKKVHQLISKIQAKLKTDKSSVDCIRAAFPAGSMVGAPKIRSLKILDELEAGPRGIYSGNIGYLSLNGNVDLNVVIRTLVIDKSKLSFGVGGAIVWMSDKYDEFEETMVKASGILGCLNSKRPNNSKHSKTTVEAESIV